MATKWDEYSSNGDTGVYNYNVYNLHEGEPAPWDVHPRMLAIQDLHMPNRNWRGSFLPGYHPILCLAHDVGAWRKALIDGELSRGKQLHRTEFVELPHLFETTIAVDGGLRYLGHHGKDVEKHWIVPFFDVKGSGRETVCEWPDAYKPEVMDPVTVHPPRVIIRKAIGCEKYTVDVVIRSRVYYYGKYTTFDRARSAVTQLFQTAMLAPEDLPGYLQIALARKYYGVVHHECLPKVEQMLLVDYSLALHILTGQCLDGRGRLEVIPESFCKQFWDNPNEALRGLENNKEALFRCFSNNKGVIDYDTAICGMKRLIPLLQGKYSKALIPLFRNAMRVPREEVTNWTSWMFGHWEDIIAKGWNK